MITEAALGDDDSSSDDSENYQVNARHVSLKVVA